MKKNIFVVIVGMLLTLSLHAQQQKDTVLTRQLELQRDFNPTLQDANKINTLPAVREPQVTKANTTYATWATRATPALEISLPNPGSVMTEIPFNLQKGYVTLNAGNYANIYGALGYRFLDKKNDKVNFIFLHNSTNGEVEYNQLSDPQRMKMRYMDNFGKLNYKHLFEGAALDLYASYLHSQFNYYGNNFGESRVHEDKNQMLGVFNVKVALQNTQTDLLNYTGSLNFHNFTTKYGWNLLDQSLTGNQIEVDLDLNKSFLGGDNLVGIKGNFTGMFYDKLILRDGTETSNFLMVDANPYIHFEGFNWKARLGANIDLVIDDENKFYVSPNIALSAMLTENSSLYLNAVGGVSKNTYLDMYKETRYLLPNTIVKHSYTPFAIDGGIKVGEIDGFRIDVFGGYKKTQDEHFFILDSDYNQDNSKTQGIYNEFLYPVLGELTHSHVGGRLQSNIWSPLEISLKLQKNFYSVEKVKGLETPPTELKAWNKPGFETDLQATFTATKELKLMLGYYFANDRWTIAKGQSIEMENINNLSAGAIYLINNMFSINVKADNILNLSYDIWYGHPAQGINVMGGFTFKF